MEDLQFLVLGPLEVRRGQHQVPARGWREQAVLAMLLLADGGTMTLEANPAGYRLPVGPGRLAARDFRHQVAAARRLAAVGSTERAAAGLRDALSLWRVTGPAGRSHPGHASRTDIRLPAAVARWDSAVESGSAPTRETRTRPESAVEGRRL